MGWQFESTDRHLGPSPSSPCGFLKFFNEQSEVFVVSRCCDLTHSDIIGQRLHVLLFPQVLLCDWSSRWSSLDSLHGHHEIEDQEQERSRCHLQSMLATCAKHVQGRIRFEKIRNISDIGHSMHEDQEECHLLGNQHVERGRQPELQSTVGWVADQVGIERQQGDQNWHLKPEGNGSDPLLKLWSIASLLHLQVYRWANFSRYIRMYCEVCYCYYHALGQSLCLPGLWTFQIL